MEEEEFEKKDEEVEKYMDEILVEGNPKEDKKARIGWIVFFSILVALMATCIIVIVHFSQ